MFTLSVQVSFNSPLGLLSTKVLNVSSHIPSSSFSSSFAVCSGGRRMKTCDWEVWRRVDKECNRVVWSKAPRSGLLDRPHLSSQPQGLLDCAVEQQHDGSGLKREATGKRICCLQVKCYVLWAIIWSVKVHYDKKKRVHKEYGPYYSDQIEFYGKNVFNMILD